MCVRMRSAMTSCACLAVVALGERGGIAGAHSCAERQRTMTKEARQGRSSSRGPVYRLWDCKGRSRDRCTRTLPDREAESYENRATDGGREHARARADSLEQGAAGLEPKNPLRQAPQGAPCPPHTAWLRLEQSAAQQRPPLCMAKPDLQAWHVVSEVHDAHANGHAVCAQAGTKDGCGQSQNGASISQAIGTQTLAGSAVGSEEGRGADALREGRGAGRAGRAGGARHARAAVGGNVLARRAH